MQQKTEQKEQDGLEVRTPLWSFQATGRTVLTVIGVVVLAGSIAVSTWVLAQQHYRKDEQDTAYQMEVIRQLKGIAWTQMQPDEVRKELGKRMEIPDSIREQMRK